MSFIHKNGLSHPTTNEIIEIEGFEYGPEIAKHAIRIKAETGLTGKDLFLAVKADYKFRMKKTTIEGMIRKGMLRTIDGQLIESFDHFLENKQDELQAKKDKQIARLLKLQADKQAKELLS